MDSGPGQDLSESHRLTVQEMCRQLTGLRNFEYSFTSIQRLTFKITNGDAKLLAENSTSLDEFSLVIFRNAKVTPDLSAAATLYLQAKKIPYANGIEGSGSWVGKIAQMVLYALSGIPVPDTICVKNYRDLVAIAGSGFSRPYILKDNQGLAGRRNFLIESDVAAEKALDGRKETYVAQTYIKNDGDYRVLFVGTDKAPMIFKRTSSSDSHLNNTSQGGQAALVSLDSFPKAALGDARKAAKLFGRDICGVDVIFDGEGNHYILETNETPSLATGFRPDLKINMLDEFSREAIV